MPGVTALSKHRTKQKSVLTKFNEIGSKVNTISSNNLKDTEDTLLGGTMLGKNEAIIESINKTVEAITGGISTADTQIANKIDELSSSITAAQNALDAERAAAAGTDTSGSKS